MRDSEYRFSESFVKFVNNMIEFNQAEKIKDNVYKHSQSGEILSPKDVRFKFKQIVENEFGDICFLFQMWSIQDPNQLYEIMFSKKFVNSNIFTQELFH